MRFSYYLSKRAFPPLFNINCDNCKTKQKKLFATILGDCCKKCITELEDTHPKFFAGIGWKNDINPQESLKNDDSFSFGYYFSKKSLIKDFKNYTGVKKITKEMIDWLKKQCEKGKDRYAFYCSKKDKEYYEEDNIIDLIEDIYWDIVGARRLYIFEAYPHSNKLNGNKFCLYKRRSRLYLSTKLFNYQKWFYGIYRKNKHIYKRMVVLEINKEKTKALVLHPYKKIFAKPKWIKYHE